MTEPLVTVVISPREGHWMAESSLMTVLADDLVPFDLIYVDFDAPPKFADALRRHAAERGFRLVVHQDWIEPSAARRALLPEIRTKYVAFADNDIAVERGCLAKLVACAEETGAALVAPLYLQGGEGAPTTIHMAGSEFVWSETAPPVLLSDHHRLTGQPAEAAAELDRAAVDFTEYHYVLARTDFVRQPGAISSDVLLVHEHLDLALFAREQGERVFFEPSARITYAAFGPRPLSDRAFFRRRWSVAGCEASAAAFAKRWPIVDADAFSGGFARQKLPEVSLRRSGSAGVDLDAPMRPEELAQSRVRLREQALGRGYSDEDVLGFEEAGDLATLLFDGVYRPDGRPFLSHAIGTASVLVRYELQAFVVRAGLLHAALTHRPPWLDADEVAAALQAAGADTLVRGQPVVSALFAGDDVDIGALNMLGVRIAAILAANDVDMRLAGEYRGTGRPPDLNPLMRQRIAQALEGFGVDGLIESSAVIEEAAQPWPVLGAPARHVSFRLDAPNRRVLPV